MTYSLENIKLGVIGLGYVGLPLAIEFGKKIKTVGFDINNSRIDQLKEGIDMTLECSTEELEEAAHLQYSSNVQDLINCNVYIVTVPTPIDIHNQPDLTPLIKASQMLGKVINKDDIVIYESTVYPGATEDTCVPELESVSGLKFNEDFFVGYSPERINPGDKLHRVTNILKVTSGSNAETADIVDRLYNEIIVAGTHKATSIKVAEASKVIENVQRDVNIALINELHQIFTRLNINTDEVIEAAATKWNFMKLKPGLVGGHCIGVDPYYLLQKATENGYVPDLMRQARDINNGMSSFLAQDFLKSLVINKISPIDCKVALLGFTFKENCPDIRNTKVYDLYNELLKLGFEIEIYDPWADKNEIKHEYGLTISNELNSNFDVGFLAVGHESIVKYINENCKDKFIYDFKNLIAK